MTPLALAILLGAFLVFQVQPILGRYVIPWFGGGASTWTTCILFFQVMLLGGYAYAHLISRRFLPNRQVAIHLGLLAVSLVFLPLRPSEPAAAVTAGSPVPGVLWVLLSRVGLPYLLLAATGPLLQSWLSVMRPGRSPYRLYALSNVGSLLALCSYPFCVEPMLRLGAQGWMWTGGYVLFALCIASTGLALRRVGDQSATHPANATAERDHVARSGTVLWVLLAAAGSLLLMATSNLVCQDLTAMPLLWVVPLALYLGTFILCFDHERWYRRWLWFPCLLLALVGMVLVLHEALVLPMWWQIALHGAVLWCGCMVCHGELSRSRPAAHDLTRFYLAVATGGALGGVFSVLIAPLLFPDYWEYHLALLLIVGLALLAGQRAGQLRPIPRAVTACGGCAGIVLAVALITQIVDKQSFDVETVRNFYGVLHVQRRADDFGREITRVIHGRTTHGTQLTGKRRRAWPTAYYGRESGVGLALAALQRSGDSPEPTGCRIGVVGLGAGTIAALAGPRDHVRFYEINPEVERVARQHFSYLADTAAEVEVVIGDGRLVLDREAEAGALKQFDLLALDAFNSDAVPMHLLTAEALAIYERHLKSASGVLAFHVSNRYVDLLPVLRGLARSAGLGQSVVVSPGEAERAGTLDAVWVLLTRNEGLLATATVRHATEPPKSTPTTLWTDEFASLLPLLKSETPISGRWHETPLRGGFVVDAGEMLTRLEEDRLLRRLRILHHDTAGACSFVVATVPQIPPGQTPARYAEALYGRLRHRPDGRDTSALLLLVGRERHVALHLGPAWTPSDRASLLALVTAGLGDPSTTTHDVARAVEHLEAGLRSRLIPASLSTPR